MRIYVAGGMTGLPDLNFPAFENATKMLREQGHTVFNPAEQGGDSTKYREYLTADLAWICTQADAIALLPGWQASKGATAEYATARALGLDVIVLEEMTEGANVV